MTTAQTDCTNTRTEGGRNATPLPIIEAAKRVFQGPFLDPASDAIINQGVGADRFFTIEMDGFARHWQHSNVWLNPPGRTQSNGEQVTAVQWIRKLYHHWDNGDIETAIALCYRSSTANSLDYAMLDDGLICWPCAKARSPIVSNSGRFAFEEIHNGRRVPQTKNPSGSAILCWSHDEAARERFKTEFSEFGVVK